MDPPWLALNRMSNHQRLILGIRVHLADLGFGRQGECILQPESDDRLRRYGKIAVSGEGCAQSSCPAAGQAADEEADPAGGESTNQHAHTRAAANEGCATLALAFFGPGQVTGIDAVDGAVDF